MPTVEVKPAFEPTILAHAITLEGRKVLIQAEGPGTNWLQRKVAEFNLERWNRGERTWLL